MSTEEPRDWDAGLPKEVYDICRLGGTEAPFSGKYNKHYEKGIYHCAVCEEPLFSSNAKYDSGSGWPSFFQPVNEDALDFHEDQTIDQLRVEVRCRKCGSHLGHVFEDGPEPTHKRFCINSLALNFKGHFF